MASITHPYFGTLDTSVIQEDFDPRCVMGTKSDFPRIKRPC